jgi:hypothetical protein
MHLAMGWLVFRPEFTMARMARMIAMMSDPKQMEPKDDHVARLKLCTVGFSGMESGERQYHVPTTPAVVQ